MAVLRSEREERTPAERVYGVRSWTRRHLMTFKRWRKNEKLVLWFDTKNFEGIIMLKGSASGV
jgi:hypothetical protein